MTDAELIAEGRALLEATDLASDYAGDMADEPRQLQAWLWNNARALFDLAARAAAAERERDATAILAYELAAALKESNNDRNAAIARAEAAEKDAGLLRDAIARIRARDAFVDAARGT